MAPTYSTVKQLLDENVKEQFIEAAKILFKFADNIIKNPTEAKYRKIRLSNPTVETKLLPVVGALECLFDMGFVEDSEFLTLPNESPLAHMIQIRDELDKELKKVQGPNGPSTERQTKPETSVARPGPVVPVQSSTPVNPLRNFSRQQIFQMEQRFFSKIQSNLVHVLMYEDPTIQLKAKSVIPVDDLKKEAQKKLTQIREADKSAVVDFRDVMLLQLLAWFKNSFFKWVDAPNCDSCNGATRSVGMAEPLPDEIRWQGHRVENYKCDRCQKFVRFPRYNHPQKLLETRCGRCGEWANCFTLCCRALGFEARYVLDWTDHVWTEVYSVSEKRWLHCDPCENVCDKPLLYDVGWGKKLSYVLAFSKDEVQDVTWRYVINQGEVLSRRNECRESWLTNVIYRLWKSKEPTNSPERNHEMKERLLIELVEFMTPKSSDGQNLSGRTSGSMAWRLARGETTLAATVSEPYTFQLTKDEIDSNLFHLKYSCAMDKYIRVSSKSEVTSGHQSCIHEIKNVFRKEEHDWKMAYLARTEGSPNAHVSWKFDFTGKKIDKIELRVSSQTFENGVINWRLCSDNSCAMLTGGTEMKTVTDLKGSSEMTLAAQMSGGVGNVAWQHTQMFRQKSDDHEFFPLEIKVHFCV